jgi:hypothetical protein
MAAAEPSAVAIDTVRSLPRRGRACFLSDGMAVSFDYWRAMQRLRTNAPPPAPARAAGATVRRRPEGGRQGRSWRVPALYLLALAAPALTALAVAPSPPAAEAPRLRDARATDGDITRRAGIDPARAKSGEAIELRQGCPGSRPAADAARLAGAGPLGQGSPACERGTADR